MTWTDKATEFISALTPGEKVKVVEALNLCSMGLGAGGGDTGVIKHVSKLLDMIKAVDEEEQ